MPYFETHMLWVLCRIVERLNYVRADRRGWYRQGSHNCIANDLWVVGSLYPDYPYICTYRKETASFETFAIAVTYGPPRQCGESVKKAAPPNHIPSGANSRSWHYVSAWGSHPDHLFRPSKILCVVEVIYWEGSPYWKGLHRKRPLYCGIQSSFPI